MRKFLNLDLSFYLLDVLNVYDVVAFSLYSVTMHLPL